MKLNADERIEVAQPFFCRFGLQTPYVAGSVKDLALKVSDVDPVVIDHADGSNPCRGQVESRRTSQPTGTDDDDGRLFEPLLRLVSKAWKSEMPSISFQLFRSQRHS